MKKEIWNVHIDRENAHEYKHDDRFSITMDTRYGGWETDSGCNGYGLPYVLAKWICDVLNQSESECPFEMRNGTWERKTMWKKDE